ncbi:MAG TPA: peptide ABC transporter substrate-binding protein [Candidatus Saccharimonadales bacterium]|nr:peptide ABC transporter substrate-binding protein [Candidatus Saccharimonadales bacterium]
MTRRDKLAVLALVGLLAVTSIVAIATDRADLPSDPAFGGTYVEGVAGAPLYFDPIIAATNVDQDVSGLVFSGLTRFDRDGAIVADLASTFEVDPTGKVWTFTIRTDANWQDGAPVTADDVVYTVGLLQDAAYTGPFADAFRGVTVDAFAPKIVRFTLPDAYAPFAGSTTVPLLPAHLLGKVAFSDLARQPFNMQPIGTGPFRVSEVDSRQVTLVRSDDFYRTKPARSRAYLDKVVLRFYRDGSEALAALARGEVDATGGLSPQDASRARTLKSVDLFSLPTNDFTALFLNVRPSKAVFRDLAVRRAIATAIDRGKVLQAALDGRGAVADEFVPPTSWAFARDIPRYPFSATDAKALLDGAGWIDHDADGIRDKGGVALKFSISTSDEPQRAAAAQRMAEDLGSVGMKVDVITVPFAELVDRVARQREFDALLVGITVGNDPDPYPFFHSSQVSDPGDDFSGYSTFATDRLLEQARKTVDQTKRRDLFAQVWTAIATDVPVVFLYYTDYLYAQSHTLQGFRVAPVNDPPQRFWNIEDWYVKTVVRQ